MRPAKAAYTNFHRLVSEPKGHSRSWAPRVDVVERKFQWNVIIPPDRHSKLLVGLALAHHSLGRFPFFCSVVLSQRTRLHTAMRWKSPRWSNLIWNVIPFSRWYRRQFSFSWNVEFAYGILSVSRVFINRPPLYVEESYPFPDQRTILYSCTVCVDGFRVPEHTESNSSIQTRTFISDSHVLQHSLCGLNLRSQPWFSPAPHKQETEADLAVSALCRPQRVGKRLHSNTHRGWWLTSLCSWAEIDSTRGREIGSFVYLDLILSGIIR